MSFTSRTEASLMSGEATNRKSNLDWMFSNDVLCLSCEAPRKSQSDHPSLVLFCVNWWCIDFNLYPLLPIHYTTQQARTLDTKASVSGVSIYLMVLCLFIMHFNYTKTSFEPQFRDAHTCYSSESRAMESSICANTVNEYSMEFKWGRKFLILAWLRLAFFLLIDTQPQNFFTHSPIWACREFGVWKCFMLHPLTPSPSRDELFKYQNAITLSKCNMFSIATRTMSVHNHNSGCCLTHLSASSSRVSARKKYVGWNHNAPRRNGRKTIHSMSFNGK